MERNAIEPKTIKIARTKNGSPCLWESYTEFDDVKRSTVIVCKDGKTKNSIFMRKSGPKQSLVPIDEGDFIVKVFKDSEGTSFSILEIEKISNMSNHADIMLKQRVQQDDGMEVEERFRNGIDTAKRKMEDPTYVASQMVKNEEDTDV